MVIRTLRAWPGQSRLWHSGVIRRCFLIWSMFWKKVLIGNLIFLRTCNQQALPCRSEHVRRCSSTATNWAVFVSVHVNIVSHFSLLILLNDDLIELISWMKIPKARPLNTVKSTDTLYSTLIPRPSILTFGRLSINAQKPPSDHFSFSLILNPIILRAWNVFGFVSWRSIPSKFLPAVPPRQRPRFSSTWSASSQQGTKRHTVVQKGPEGSFNIFTHGFYSTKVSYCLYECEV